MEEIDKESVQDSCDPSLKAGNIKAIDKQSVHRICSGQVVLNLATAVKELVENSLDAGANAIEVRLREYGSDLVEVLDNGQGVKQENFEGLTLKHHTSKLTDFSDLTSVDTFGFRGEALSSLCALSKLTITTCHKDTEVARKLEYDHSGKLLATTPCARQTGTTVSLQNLFSTLPVRHKEFQRNLKKEFNKMVQVLNAYCIISTKVKLTCTNQVGKGKKNIIVNTNGNDTMKENITNIFGSKQIQSLLEFVQYDPREEECSEYYLKVNNSNVFKINGYISTCSHGQGRSATDRQFIFINKRPCDLVKISRVVNEVYHVYNRHQYPFLVLDINLHKESVDVNVTPDKRQIFMENEKLLLATIKTSLLKLLEPQASVFQLNHGVNKLSSSPSVLAAFSRKSPMKTHQSSPAVLQNGQSSLSSTLSKLKRSFTSAFSKDTSNVGNEREDKGVEATNAKQRKLDTFVVKSTPITDICDSNTYSDNKETIKESESNNLHNDITETSMTPVSSYNDEVVMYSKIENKEDDTAESLDNEYRLNNQSQDSTVVNESFKVIFVNEFIKPDDTLSATSSKRDNESERNVDLDLNSGHPNNSTIESIPVITIPKHPKESDCDTDSEEMNNEEMESQEIYEEKASVSMHETERSSCHNKDYEITVTEMDEGSDKITRKEVKLPFSFSKLKQKLQRHEASKKAQKSKTCRSFRAKITPGDNSSAEEELAKQISKDMFSKMEILGQFNLGFIIARLEQDLFIIDQHATDEKYNFEMLQRHTVIQNQKLIQPQTLELTAANETILMDNVDVFHKNGFDFLINEEDPPTQRVKLVSMPVSKNWTFGKDDIEELIFMLSDSPGVMCRPSRVRMMFASRACRKSIMIGTALNRAEMKKLLGHMSDIDQPWNCPHGRPTMRHLINMDMLPD